MDALSHDETTPGLKLPGKKKTTFVPDFPSPADEIKKTNSNKEPQKTNEINIFFSRSSENWFG